MKIKIDFINIELIFCGCLVVFIFDKSCNFIYEIYKYNIDIMLEWV